MANFQIQNVQAIVKNFAIQSESFFDPDMHGVADSVRETGTLFLPFQVPFYAPTKPGQPAPPDHRQLVLVCRNGLDMVNCRTRLFFEAVCHNNTEGLRTSGYGKSKGEAAAIDALSKVWTLSSNSDVLMLPAKLINTPFVFEQQPLLVESPTIPLPLYKLRTTDLKLKF